MTSTPTKTAMDDLRIDAIARLLAAGAPRRQLLGALAAALLAGPVLPVGVTAACAKPGRPCDRRGDCCEGARCAQGECRCKGSRTECGNDCVKTDSDEDHCGVCGNACRAGETCCDGDCADLRADADDCGRCGRRCGGGETCVAGVCTTADGCPVGADTCGAGGRVDCGEVPGCVCSPTTEGTTICSYTFTTFSACGECETSADCAVFDPAAVCVVARGSSGPCCGLDNPTVCRLPCPTPSLAGRQGDNKRSEHGTPRRNSPIGRTRTDATRLNNGAGVGGPR